VTLEDWTAVGSIATALLAVATFLAIRQGRQERKEFAADRELAWRPALNSENFDKFRNLQDDPSIELNVSHRPSLLNAGGGPALFSRVLWFMYVGPFEGEWFLSTPLDIAAKASGAPVGGVAFEPDEIVPIIESIRPTNAETLRGALLCRDFLDRRWCFPVLQADGLDPVVLTPISWRPPSGRRGGGPVWATSEIVWGSQGPRLRPLTQG
jgi:hypothetical protein